MRRLAQGFSLVMALAVLGGCTPAPSVVEDSQPSHALVGRPAPLFTAKYLDGAPFDLAQHLGQKVVVLDFWATWCGPCRAAMPILSEVTGQFNQLGAELFAVNIEESPPEVKAFLEQAGLELTVVLDETGEVSSRYKAEAIPQTVLIDRQGVVRFVHVGVSPNLRDELTQQLTELTSEPVPPSVPSSEESAAVQ